MPNQSSQTPEFDAEKIQSVIRQYGETLQGIEPTAFHDATLLPCPKDEIREALLTAIRFVPDAEVRGSLEISLILLAQFQEGVGPEPVSPFPDDPGALLKAYEAGEISTRDIADRIIGTEEGPEQQKLLGLLAAWRKEAASYRDLIRQAKGN